MKLPMKISFSNISLIFSWWHWHPICQVPFWTCLFSVLYLKYKIRCSLARGLSWAESCRLCVWCALLLLRCSDLPVFCLLWFFFLCFFQNHFKFDNTVIWISHSPRTPPPAMLFINYTVFERVRIPYGLAELCSMWGSCALSQWSFHWSPTGTLTDWSSSL